MPLTAAGLDEIVAGARRRAGIERLTCHQLRHACFTRLQVGVPVKVISERLGHANPAFTISPYQHVIPGMQADAATVFSNLIAGALEPPQPLDVAAEDDE